MTLHQCGVPALSVNAGAGNHQWMENDWERLERFSEMKKYELALANWKKRKAEEAARRSQQYMDEIAIRGYIRRDVQ